MIFYLIFILIVIDSTTSVKTFKTKQGIIRGRQTQKTIEYLG
mgnify:CR=1 FL=1